MKRNPYPNQKPQLGAEVDWSNPLSRGLDWCFLFNEGSGKPKPELSTTFTGYTWSDDGLQANAAAPIDYRLKAGVFIPKEVGTLMMTFSIPYVQYARPFSTTSPSHSTRIELASATQIYFAMGNGAATTAITATIPTTLVQVRNTYIATWDVVGTKIALYINGIFVKESDARGDVVPPQTESVSFGEGFNGVDACNIHLGNAYMWDRALSPSEVAQLYYEPYGHFLVPGLPIYYSISYTPQAYFANISQGLGIAAVATRQLAAGRGIAQGLGMAATPGRGLVAGRGVGQTLGISAVPTRALVAARGIAQTLGISAVPTRALVAGRAIAIGLALAATATSARAFGRNIAQSLSVYSVGGVPTMTTDLSLSATVTHRFGGMVQRGFNRLLPDWFKVKRPGALVPKEFFWLRADEITTLADGDYVTLWPDKSTYDLDAVQGGGVSLFKPIWKDAITNGEPVVRFIDAIEFMYPPLSYRLNPIDEMTIFCVASIASLTADNRYIFGKREKALTAPAWGLAFREVGGITYAHVDVRTVDADDSFDAEVTVVSNQFYVWTLTFRPSVGGIDVHLRQDGVDIDSKDVVGHHLIGYGYVVMLGNSSGYADALPCDLAELRIYNRIADAAFVGTTETDLATRYL